MKKNVLTLIFFSLFASLMSCSSVSENVIVRMQGHDDKPDWATLAKSTYIKNGRLYSVGFTEVGANSRISAAFRISDNNARFEISREVTDDMAFIFQNMEEGMDDAGTLARFYGTEVSKLVAHNIRQEHRYWEKVQTFDEMGDTVYRVRLYSLVSIKQTDLRKAVKESLDKGRSITPEIKNQIDQHITREIQNLVSPKIRIGSCDTSFVVWLHSLSVGSPLPAGSFSKKTRYHYYVGVSDKEDSLSKAMEGAYLNAVKEAVRHNYGFEQKMVESFFNEIESTKVDQSYFWKSENISLRGIEPVKERVEEVDGKYVVYRQIRYLKSEIAKEKRRLRTHRNSILNKYGMSGSNLGQIEVRTVPVGADIVLASQFERKSVFGKGDALINAPIGRYKLTITKEGYEPYQKEVTISGKKNLHSAILKQSTGEVSINVSPYNASIYLDGKLVQNNETYVLPILGTHDLHIEHPDYHGETRTFSLWINEKNDIRVNLTPKPASLSLISRPVGSNVYIDGKLIGASPIKKYQLPAGRYQIEIRKSGFETYSFRQKVEPNRDILPKIITLRKVKVKTRKKKSTWKPDPNLSSVQLIYNPVITEAKQTTFYDLALGMNFFMFSHLSLGVDYRYKTSSENNDEIQKEYNMTSVNLMIYPYRTKKFALGAGIEQNYRKLKVEEFLEAEEYEKTSVGSKVSLQYQLGKDSGIQMDHRLLDRENHRDNSFSVGVYFDF